MADAKNKEKKLISLNASKVVSSPNRNELQTSTGAKKENAVQDNPKSNPIENVDPYSIIRAPLSTEKAIRNIEFDNKLSFVVHPQATKADVKQAVETLFKVKVIKVNIQNSIQGQKRAYVKLSTRNLASDVSADLGLI